MTNYIDLHVGIQHGKAEIKINGRAVKTAADFEKVLKTVQTSDLSTLLNEIKKLERLIES